MIYFDLKEHIFQKSSAVAKVVEKHTTNCWLVKEIRFNLQYAAPKFGTGVTNVAFPNSTEITPSRSLFVLLLLYAASTKE